MPEDVSNMRLIDKDTAEVFTFKTRTELSEFKYQRYMQRYLRCIQSIDDNTGRLLDYIDQAGLSENTMVIYTSDQGFFVSCSCHSSLLIPFPASSFHLPRLIPFPASTFRLPRLALAFRRSFSEQRLTFLFLTARRTRMVRQALHLRGVVPNALPH